MESSFGKVAGGQSEKTFCEIRYIIAVFNATNNSFFVLEPRYELVFILCVCLFPSTVEAFPE